MRRRLRTPAARGADGVTLAELLVVVAIIGLVLFIAVPRFGTQGGTTALRAGARELSATMREARRLAIAERANMAVVIDCNAFSSSGADAELVTRYWIARIDRLYDPLASDPVIGAPGQDATDVPRGDAVGPFDGEFTTLERQGDVQELPRNVVVVATMIASTGYLGDDFSPAIRLNAWRTEDVNMDAALAAAEDLGVDGFDDGDGAANEPVDAGEDDAIDSSLYRVVRFGPQGGADRAIIWLWNTTDGGATLPGGIAANAPASLRTLGLPPGMSVQDPADQQNYFTVTDQTQDAHYYTVAVNPTTGTTEVFDYARGTAAAGGPPFDWDLDKDGAS